jgi:hypothetical protein
MADLSSHEVFFGCLEFLLVMIAMYIFLYYHPGRWLGKMVPQNSAQMSRLRSNVREVFEDFVLFSLGKEVYHRIRAGFQWLVCVIRLGLSP